MQDLLHSRWGRVEGFRGTPQQLRTWSEPVPPSCCLPQTTLRSDILTTGQQRRGHRGVVLRFLRGRSRGGTQEAALSKPSSEPCSVCFPSVKTPRRSSLGQATLAELGAPPEVRWPVWGGAVQGMSSKDSCPRWLLWGRGSPSPPCPHLQDGLHAATVPQCWVGAAVQRNS